MRGRRCAVGTTWIICFLFREFVLQVSGNEPTGVLEPSAAFSTLSSATTPPQNSFETAVLSGVDFSAQRDLKNLFPPDNSSDIVSPENLVRERLKRQQRFRPSNPNYTTYEINNAVSPSAPTPSNVYLSCPFPHPGMTIQDKLLAGIPVSSNRESGSSGDTGYERRAEGQNDRYAARSTHPYRVDHSDIHRVTPRNDVRQEDRHITESPYYQPIHPADARTDDTQDGSGVGPRNMATEIELLRFTNDRGVLADGQPCEGFGDGGCSYRFSGVIKISEESSPATLITAKQGKNVVDINARTKRVACGVPRNSQQAVLQVAVTSLPAGEEIPLHRLKRRQIRISWPSSSSNSDRSHNNQRARVDSELGNSEYHVALDEHRRDGYGDSNRPSGQSGAVLVNVFDCPVRIAGVDEESYTPQWETQNCIAKHRDLQMELMFRYIVYNLDDHECAQQSRDEKNNNQWTPLGTSE